VIRTSLAFKFRLQDDNTVTEAAASARRPICVDRFKIGIKEFAKKKSKIKYCVDWLIIIRRKIYRTTPYFVIIERVPNQNTNILLMQANINIFFCPTRFDPIGPSSGK
jgi:hypothetical protein